MPDGGCCRGSRGRFDLPELDTALIIACRIRSAVALHFARYHPCGASDAARDSGDAGPALRITSGRLPS